MKKQLLTLTALLIATIGSSQTVGDLFTENFIDYQVTSITPNEVRIEDYDANGGTTVDIPATIINSGTTYNVTEIYQVSFFNKGLTSVTIPNTISSIGDAAFTTNNLTNITIPNSVISIGTSSFQNNQIADVIIPSSVTSIGNSAFKNNPLITVSSGATIPPTIITGGGGDTFNSNRSGIDLVIPTGTAAAYTAATWTGFNSVTEAAALAVADTFVVDFITYEVTSVLPNTVEAIDYNMAGGAVVDIPAYVPSNISVYAVTSIGPLAFFNNQLTSIDIPSSVTSIGEKAFQDNLITIAELPDGLISIPIDLFRNNQITNINIPNTVTSIGFTAFYNNQLTSITIPSNVTSIGIYAFQNNPLTEVYSLSTTPPTIATGTDDTFSTNRSNIELHIPAGTMGAYVTDPGALWTGFNPVTEDALSVSHFELVNTIKVVTTTNGISIIASNNLRLENYTIYSLSGAKVSTGNESEISTSFLANGIYLLKLDFDRGTLVKKIIIQ